ncbi:NAD(P)H-dependent oxidoreductase subunit E [Candidatus Sumerlaeota bacterium]|nr:NAD(P)H-dependent oxidoreductase subunit E [Candidatus Sumerlaeota bacterium]
MEQTAVSQIQDIKPDDLMVLGDRMSEIRELAGKYPERGSLTLPLLWMVQRQEGYVTEDGKRDIALLTGKRLAEVQEVVTFYTQYFQQPVGKYCLGVCRTLPCALNGAGGMFDYLSEKLGVKNGETTEDGKFTLLAYECLGACSEAPVLLVNEKTYTRMTKAKLDALLESME